MPDLIRLAGILTVVCLISAGALGMTEAWTKPIRDEYARKKQELALKKVLPKGTVEVKHEKGWIIDLKKLDKKTFDSYKSVLTDEQEARHAVRVFKGFDAHHKLTGYAVKVGSVGFSSEIQIIVGVSPDLNRITGTFVLDEKETPGLGAEMETVAYGDTTGLPAWQKQFKNLAFKRDGHIEELMVKKDGGRIDAITASTISSRAFCKGVRKAIELLGNPPLAKWKGGPR